MLRRRVPLLCMAAATPNAERVRFAKEGKPASKNMTPQLNQHVHKATRQRQIKERSMFRGKAIFEATSAVQHALETTTDARTLRMSQLTDQIFNRGATFLTSACNISFVPDGNPAIPEIAFVGRQQVGKTALLRSLFKDRYVVGHANTRKRKDAISFFDVGGVFNVVECPGYGSRSCPFHLVLQHAALIRNFVRCRPSLKMLYYVLDTHEFYGLAAQDVDMLKYLSQEVPNFTIVITKGDKLWDEERRKKAPRMSTHRIAPSDIMKELELNGIHHPMLITSAFTLGGLDTLRYDMVSNALHALPTEMLTYNEAVKLGQRLLTQQEIGSVRPLQLVPTERDDEEHEWQREIAAERLAEEAKHLPLIGEGSSAAAAASHALGGDDGGVMGSHSEESSYQNHNHGLSHDAEADAAPSSSSSEGDEQFDLEAEDDECDTAAMAELYGEDAAMLTRDGVRASIEADVDEMLDMGEGAATEATGAVTIAEEGEAMTQLATVASPREALAAVDSSAYSAQMQAAAADQQRNFLSLSKKLEDKNHLAFVKATSPWRNPTLWPPNVIPTRSLRRNIMKCPDDPLNPYLTQPRFVAPRMDMYFRRPSSKNVGKRGKDKGLYHADANIASLDSAYTIPYFPTIQDVHMMPKPQHFSGISRYFSAHGEGRLEGLLALKQLRDELTNPLGNTADIQNPMLREEVMKLEDQHYADHTAALLEASAALEAAKAGPPQIESSSAPDAASPSPPSAPRKSRIAFLKPKE